MHLALNQVLSLHLQISVIYHQCILHWFCYMFYSQIHCYLFHKFLDHLLFHFYDLGIGPLLTENNNLLFVSFLLIMSSNKCLNYYLIFLIPTDSPNLNLTLLLVVIHKSLFLSLCTLLSYSFSFLLCMILVQALIIIKIYC